VCNNVSVQFSVQSQIGRITVSTVIIVTDKFDVKLTVYDPATIYL